MWQSLPRCNSHWEAMRCVSTADYDMGGWWRRHPQNYCALFILAPKKDNLATGSWATPNKLCQCLRAKSGNFLRYTTHVGVRMFTIPGAGGREKTTFFLVADLMRAAGYSNGNMYNIHVFYLPKKMSLLVKPAVLPFYFSSSRTSPLRDSQHSAVEKCFYFEILGDRIRNSSE